MRVVTFQPYPFEATYFSFEACLAGAMNHPLQPKAREDTEALAASRLVDAYWTDTDFVFQFSIGKCLHVFLREKRVAWEVSDTLPELESSNPEHVGSNPVLCRWSSGEHLMDRSSLVSARLNKEFWQLFVNEGLWLYFRGMEILYFAAVRYVESDRPFLYVGESD
jgi:hypothetical protein